MTLTTAMCPWPVLAAALRPEIKGSVWLDMVVELRMHIVYVCCGAAQLPGS